MKKKSNFSFILICFLLISIYLIYNLSSLFKSQSPIYSGKGQASFSGYDGYTTTFTTISEHKKTYIEYKQNQDSSWSNKDYWGGTMAENGCGITSLAIIASGYGLNITPETLRKKYYPHLKGEQIPTELKSLGISCSDFYFSNAYFSEEYIGNWLRSNRPVLVCLNSTKKNKWTAASHYMVLLAVSENNLVYVSNPNGIDGTNTSSGWYNFNEILPYIAKALFVEKY